MHINSVDMSVPALMILHLIPFFFSAQVKVFVDGLFFLNKNNAGFKEHLRDFLVQIKVIN